MTAICTPDVEARDGTVVAYFPRGIDAAFLSPADAREWARALDRAADAVDVLSPASRQGARLLRDSAPSA